MFKGILNKLFKPKAAQVESPFVLFDVYLNNLKAIVDYDKDDDNAAYENLQESSFLVSNEYGEQVKRYNQNVATFFNLPKIERQVECAGDSENEICTHTLKYQDKLISWQEVPNLASDDFEVFMMSKLVADDIEIRFDVSSSIQSDQNWYALTADIWQRLEDKHSVEIVRSHFEPISEEFCESDYKLELILNEL